MSCVNGWLHTESALQVYMSSKRGAKEFGSQSSNMRCAVAVARQLQRPEMEWAATAACDDDLFAVKIHPLQASRGRIAGCLSWLRIALIASG